MVRVLFKYRCFCISYFNPTINSNMLQYISSSTDKLLLSQEVSNHFNDLLAGLLMDLEHLINCETLKHTLHFLYNRIGRVIRVCRGSE